MEYDPKIFIIMPFSKTTNHSEEYWSNHYEHLLKISIQSISNLPVERSTVIRKDILRDIIKNLIFSQIVLADITDLNANVMWELGVRQSFRNGTIVIAEVGTPIPFDLLIKGVLFYPKLTEDPKYHGEMKKFKDNLKIAINDCIRNPDVNDSAVLETTSGRGTIYEIISREEIKRKLDALIYEFQCNSQFLFACMENIEENKGIKKGARYIWATNRMRANSIEHLIVNRYLNQDIDFYSRLDNCHNFLLMCNSMLELWPTDRKSTETWFTQFCDEIEENFEEMLSAIREIRLRMENLA
jgi:hypothetical protein